MAQILLGYILTNKLPGLANKATQHQAFANLFHICMRDVLQSIIEPGKNGVAIMSDNGVWRWCHPLFATFIGDYPEHKMG